MEVSRRWVHTGGGSKRSGAPLAFADGRSGETGGRQDSTESILVGVGEKHFVVHPWTLCQKVFRRVVVPTLGVNRSAP